MSLTRNGGVFDEISMDDSFDEWFFLVLSSSTSKSLVRVRPRCIESISKYNDYSIHVKMRSGAEYSLIGITHKQLIDTISAG